MMRGINQQRIFDDDNDYLYFLTKLKDIKSESDMAVLSYCLMSNHVHLLMLEGEVSLGDFFRRFGAAYAYYFNRKYQRQGYLFQGRFKSEPIEDEAYLIQVINYIHKNPVNAGVCMRADEYRWSSLATLGKKDCLVDTKELFSMVGENEIRSLAGKLPERDPFDRQKRGIKPRYSDDEAVALMDSCCGVKTASQFQRLREAQQKEAVENLRQQGVSIRQIARLGGMSKGLVERWSKPLSKT
jgi:REP element-mobilizing transposase RayT